MTLFSIAKGTFFFLIFHFLVLYIGWNLSVFLHDFFPFYHAVIFWVVYFLFTYSFLLGRINIRLSLFWIIGSYWVGFFQYALLILPFSDLFVLLHMPIYLVGILSILVFLAIWIYGMFNAYSPIIRRFDISVPKPSIHKTLTIAVASDMHFGWLSGRRHARRLSKHVNSLKPDLVLYPGDIIDDDPQVFIDKNISDILGKIHAPFGVYATLGNHDYYGKKTKELKKELHCVGVRLLEDEVVEIDGFYVIGRNDKTDKNRLSVSELMKNLDDKKPIFMMDHQPDEIHIIDQHKVDVSFSGHTHRGQMAPNHLITKRVFELDWGYKKKEHLHAFVSSGFGFWGPPLRLGSRSEIQFITVHFN